jgi:uncharacterized protein YciI
MIKLSLAVAIIVFSAFAVLGQTAGKPNPDYDAALAKKLGGNDNGLKSYVLVVLKTGPNDASMKGEERTKAFQGHFANINKLANEGKMAIAGPFGKNDKSFRGLFILNTTSLDEARSWTEADPTVKSGIFVVDYIPWFGSASLMATYEIHKKISKSIE